MEKNPATGKEDKTDGTKKARTSKRGTQERGTQRVRDHKRERDMRGWGNRGYA